MSLGQWKDVLDIFVKFMTLVFGIPAAVLAYKRWFRPAQIGAGLDSILLLGPHACAEDHVESSNVLVAAQVRLYNAGAMPESIINVRMFNLQISQADQNASYSAFVALRPLKLSARKPDEPAKFHIQPSELAHSFVLGSQDQVVLHFLFFPDAKQQFEPQAGRLKLTLGFEAESARGKALVLPPIMRCLTLTQADVQSLLSGQKVGFLSWHMEPC